MKKLILLLIAVTVVSCELKDNPTDPNVTTRNYYLGFTPFPYDVSAEAQEYVYTKISTDADIILHHFDDGIPWEESLYDQDYHTNITVDWQYRISKTPLTHKKVVAVTPINFERNGLALYKNAHGDQPLPTPWLFYNFNNPNVKTAYLNYCKRIIQNFNPDYIIIGIEVNLLINADETMNKWNAYLDLHKYVYSELKKIYPRLPIMVSLSGMDLINDYTTANNTLQLVGFNNILPYTDYFAISLYPFLSKYFAESIPTDLFKLLFAMSSKPICITETGYPAQTFSIQGGSIVFNGSPEKQKNYIEQMFDACDNNDVRFIVNFVLRDYDELWEDFGSPDDITKVWRDTGLYDENGNVRPSYEVWKNKLNIKVE